MRVFRGIALFLLLSGLGSTWASAQMIGIAALLNPEGSRLFPQSIIGPRHPGKPDPRWKRFNWQFAEMTSGPARYKLYFYDDEEWTTRFVAPRIQNHVSSLASTFQFSPPETFSYLLFTSLREFQQANIFFITEGVQGVTSTTEATMAIPYWGDARAFDHVSKHEMVHQFQVQKLMIGGDVHSQETAATTPLWFIEGMAEYYSLGNNLDAESRMFLRDLVLNPDSKRDYKMPGFLEEGALDFSRVYKAGQAKIDFLEKEFGAGTSQRILNRLAKGEGDRAAPFPAVTVAELKVTPEDLQARWQSYIDREFRGASEKLRQTVQDGDLVKEAEDNLDHFDISPDGSLAAIRNIDPLTGVSSIQVMPLARPEMKVEAARDRNLNSLSLYFMQVPSVTISNNLVAYAVDTTAGPEIEIRRIFKNGGDALTLGKAQRIPVHKNGLIQISSLCVAPDEKQLAITALSPKGWSNLYTLNLGDKEPAAKALTQNYYDWRTCDWTETGLLASSDQTAEMIHAIFSVDPASGAQKQLTNGTKEHLAPDGSAERFVYQSWESGSSQISLVEKGQERRLTEVKTGLLNPKLRGDSLYALVFQGGRFKMARMSLSALQALPPWEKPKRALERAPGEPWKATLSELPQGSVQSYRPFVSSGTRIDGLMAYFSSGSVGGIGTSVSDLMRNYSLSAELSVFGGWKYTNAYAFLTSEAGRTTWTTGAYGIVQPRLDNIFGDNGTVRTYLQREYGVLGAIQYPLTGFSYVDLALKIGGVKRTDYSDSTLAPAWEAVNPGTEFMLGPTFRWGYDGIIYEAYSGPISGAGFLFESDLSYFPKRKAIAERLRFDASRYFRLLGRTVLAFQGMGGVSWGKDYGSPFLISSDDILRAYSFFDSRLYGNYVVAGKSELRFPIGSLFGFPPLRGVAAFDYGSVFRVPQDAVSRISSSYSGGLNINVPPLTIGFLLSYPIRVAPGPIDSPVAHFTLRYLYL